MISLEIASQSFRCPEFSQVELAAAAAGWLNEERANLLSSHLEGCLACQAEMRELVASVIHQPTPELPGDDENDESINAFLSLNKFLPPAISEYQNGDRIDHYEVISQLGKGGSGTVYECVDTQMGRHVAVKVLNQPSFFSARQARYEREARTLARLDHPWIVKAFEIKSHHYPPYIVMELVAGGTSKKLIKSGPIDPLLAARLVAGVARAVQHAHDHNILHRDIKPANLLLVESAIGEKNRAELITLKVSDFGLARPMENDSRLTTTDNIMGTPAYMSPEQARGNQAKVGPTSDIYSLGVVLYEYLIGKPPLVAESAVQTLRLVNEVEPVAPRQILPGIPIDLDTICMKCLRKGPSERYTTAGDLADDLDRFLQKRPILARPIGPAARLYRWVRRNPNLAATIGTSLLLLTSLVGLSIRFAMIQNQMRLEAERNTTLFKQSEEKARNAAQDAADERDFARNLFFGSVRNLEIYAGQLMQIKKLAQAPQIAETARSLNKTTIQQYANRYRISGQLHGDAFQNLFRDAIAFRDLGYTDNAYEIFHQLIEHSRKLSAKDPDYNRSQRVANQCASAIACDMRLKGQNGQAVRLLQDFHWKQAPDYSRTDQPLGDLIVLKALLDTYIDSLRDDGQATLADALMPRNELLGTAILKKNSLREQVQEPVGP